MKRRAFYPMVLTVLAACGDDTYTVGGSVAGLVGSVVLTNGNVDNVTVSTPGAFTFSQTVKSGAHYWVAVLTQPATQTCSIENNSGAIDGDDVTDVSVTCAVDAHTVGGSVSGLDGTLVLTNNGSDTLTVTADGRFQFANALAIGAAYHVAIQTQPAAQTCTLTNADGTATSDITSVAVTCSAKTFSIGGSVAGLSGSVVLQNNAGDDLTLTADGAFEFATAVAYGESYDVTVRVQPDTQTCTVSNNQDVATADVTTVRVTCVVNVQVGGTVSGLSGTLRITNNGATPRIITTNGSYAFTVAKGSQYRVMIEQQPVGQTCSVTNGGPFTANANVNNIGITCATNQFTVGGTLSGLEGTVFLQLNGGDTLATSTNGQLTFPTPLAAGEAYDVIVFQQPANQTCTVTNGSGTVGQSNVTNIAVFCTID